MSYSYVRSNTACIFPIYYHFLSLWYRTFESSVEQSFISVNSVRTSVSSSVRTVGSWLSVIDPHWNESADFQPIIARKA